MRKMGVTYRTGNMLYQSPRPDCQSLLNHPSSRFAFMDNLCMSKCFQEALTNIQPGEIFEDAKYISTLYRKALTAFRNDDVFCLIPLCLMGKFSENFSKKKPEQYFMDVKIFNCAILPPKVRMPSIVFTLFLLKKTELCSFPHLSM
jgi:hypothetical protein